MLGECTFGVHCVGVCMGALGAIKLFAITKFNEPCRSLCLISQRESLP